MTPKSRGTSQDATPETDVVEILDDELAGAITEVDDPKATPDDAVSMTKPAAKAAAEVAVPEAKAPDVKVPQVAAPDVKAPDVKVPDVEHTQPVQKVEDTIVDTPAQAPVVIPPAAPPVAKAGAKGGLVGKVSGVTSGLKEKVTPVVKPATSTPAASASTSSSRNPRKARLRLVHIDPWSVLKTSFVLSVALGIAMLVATMMIYGLLSITGVFDALNAAVGPILGESSDFSIQDFVGLGRVLGLTALTAVVNTFLLPAIATLAAYLYNLAATLLGGVELTLAEDN